MRNPIAVLFWDVRPRRKIKILTAFLAIAFVLGTLTPRSPHYVYHGVELVSPLSGDPTIDQSLDFWRTEVARRFPDALVYATHGGDMLGEWVSLNPAVPGELETVANLAHRLQVENPGRVIVLLVCNPGHYNLHIPGVYHAMDSVWFVPDKNSDNQSSGRTVEDPGTVGNIYEFTDA